MEDDSLEPHAVFFAGANFRERRVDFFTDVIGTAKETWDVNKFIDLLNSRVAQTPPKAENIRVCLQETGLSLTYQVPESKVAQYERIRDALEYAKTTITNRDQLAGLKPEGKDDHHS